MISGINYPLCTAGFGGLYLFARIGYHFGYVRTPSGRVPCSHFVTVLQLIMPFGAIGSLAMFYLKTDEGNENIHYGSTIF